VHVCLCVCVCVCVCLCVCVLGGGVGGGHLGPAGAALRAAQGSRGGCEAAPPRPLLQRAAGRLQRCWLAARASSAAGGSGGRRRCTGRKQRLCC
jgi:hypothetical protein